jgi:hypothetical protein
VGAGGGPAEDGGGPAEEERRELALRAQQLEERKQRLAEEERASQASKCGQPGTEQKVQIVKSADGKVQVCNLLPGQQLVKDARPLFMGHSLDINTPLFRLISLTLSTVWQMWCGGAEQMAGQVVECSL